MSEREKTQKNRFVEEIIDLISEVDDAAQLEGMASVQDFSNSMVDGAIVRDFDADQQVNSNDYAALQYEDSIMMRNSVIIKAYEDQLSKVDAAKLSLQDKHHFDRATFLIGYLKNIKVIDAAVLLKIVKLYESK